MSSEPNIATSAESFDSSHSMNKDHRNILVCVDGSEFCLHAFTFYLENIYRPSDNVILLSVIEPQDVMGPTAMGAVPANLASLYKAAMEERKHEVEKTMRNYKKEADEHSVTKASYRILVSTDVGHSICEYSHRHHIDFIVLGTRGLGTMRRTFLGSVSNHVLHHAHIPVMIRPPSVDEKHSHHSHSKDT